METRILKKIIMETWFLKKIKIITETWILKERKNNGDNYFEKKFNWNMNCEKKNLSNNFEKY